MRTIFIIMFLLFYSCATATYNNGLESYIQRFEQYCNCKINMRIKITPISQTEKDYKTVGVCYGFKMSKLFRSIEIDEGYWNSASDCERESTIFHELGHCYLDLDHDSSVIQGDYYLFARPKSLMHPYTFPQYCANKEEYIKELFSHKK